MVQLIPNTAGQPTSRLSINTQCLFSVEDLDNYGEERILIMFQALLPLTAFICFFIIIFIFGRYKIWEVGHYHKYTMINVVFLFFQPDCLSFFTKALSCRKIGSESYRFVNLMLSCSDKSYKTFSYSFVIPNLLFWAVTPGVILFFLRKQKGINNEKLAYCTTKYKFGYFYLEFKPNFYYWEFVRIYLKIAIIFVNSLMNDAQNEVYVLCMAIFFAYIILTTRKAPFQSRFLFRLELASYEILIPCIIFQILYNKYPYDIFQGMMAFIHYGYIMFMITIIMKFKIISSQNRLSKLFKFIFSRICFRSLYARIVKRTQNNKALLRWRKVYMNLIKIKAENISKKAINLQQIALQYTMSTQRNRNYLQSIEFQSLLNQIRSGTSTPKINMAISQTEEENKFQNTQFASKFKNKLNEGIYANDIHTQQQMILFNRNKQFSRKFDFTVSPQLNEVNSISSQSNEDPFNQDIKNVLSQETILSSPQSRPLMINLNQIPNEESYVNTFNESIAFKSPQNRFLINFKQQQTENK